MNGTTTALDKLNSSAPGESANDSSVRSASNTRASRAQRRAGTPVPQVLPEWVRPALGPLSSTFGARWGTQHKGVDIAASYGSTVRAASAGVVVVSDWSGGYGKLVEINHGNGLTTRYGHNSALLVKVGQRVEAGQPIAKIGSTGYSTGPHCHFEIRKGEEAIDPLKFMRQQDVDLASNVDPSR
jgi:murein DD-endopeptidase MepM/ murein hydrolase activator NlpD